MKRKLQLIVEGDGDVKAVPELVRRILKSHKIFDVIIAEPTQRRGELPKVKRDFENIFRIATIEKYPVLLVLDFDCDECVNVISEEKSFQASAQKIYPHYPFAACFIVKEYESLFLSDPQAVKEFFPQIQTEYEFPLDPEAIRDAKGELSRLQKKGWAYKPTVHQTELSKIVKLDILRRKSPSFKRLEAAVIALFKP